MKTIEPKKETNVVRGKLPPVPTGHVPHQSGSGKHSSKPKRLRTRQAERKRSIQEQI